MCFDERKKTLTDDFRSCEKLKAHTQYSKLLVEIEKRIIYFWDVQTPRWKSLLPQDDLCLIRFCSSYTEEIKLSNLNQINQTNNLLKASICMLFLMHRMTNGSSFVPGLID